MQLCFLIGWNDKSVSDRPWPVSRTFFKLYTYKHNVFFWLPFDCELTHWCMYTEPSRWNPCFWTPTGTDIFCICWRTRNNRPRPTWPSSSSTTTNMEGRTDPCKTKNINSHCARERKGILGQNLEILHVLKSKLFFSSLVIRMLNEIWSWGFFFNVISHDFTLPGQRYWGKRIIPMMR